jgi:hypothetical protein
MDGEAIVAVSAAVVALTQLVKWGGIPDKYGPFAVLGLSALGVLFWGWSEGVFERAKAFEYFAGWIAVATGAAGVYGFTRAAGSGVARMSPPPSTGAGNSPTVE